jgi:hypothetical protein
MAEQSRGAGKGARSEKECPNCGMPRSDWPDESGCTEDGKTYCCEGCATGTGCTCE